jgi:hypothetical protein
MIFGMKYSAGDWLLMTVGTSKFTIREIVDSSVWPKHKAQTKR